MNINKTGILSAEVHTYDVHGAEATQMGHYKGLSMPSRLTVEYTKSWSASGKQTSVAITIMASNVLANGRPGKYQRQIYYGVSEAPEWAQRIAADEAPWNVGAA